MAMNDVFFLCLRQQSTCNFKKSGGGGGSGLDYVILLSQGGGGVGYGGEGGKCQKMITLYVNDPLPNIEPSPIIDCRQ